MKTLLNDTVAAEVEGAIRGRELGIAANAKAFKELISGIYSDKAYAINREYFANAFDAHKMAGNAERPFDVHLPTLFEPFYYIRDYGISMTDDLVFDIFSQLFMSTKDDPNSEESNLQVGKFGLGSKSAFSYTDAFILTTYLNGEQRIYDVYFNAGKPRIDLFSSEPTEEENGVRIEFPVDPKDIDDFRKSAVRATEGLDVAPNFVGHVPTLIERTVISSGTGWQLLNGTYTGMAEAKQGTVLYPLSHHGVQGLPDELIPLFKMPIRIDFPIGELEVITSREALSYDERTSQNIINRLREVAEELSQDLYDLFGSATTYHEACKVYFNKIKGKYPDHFIQLAWGNKKPKFKGREVEEYIDILITDIRRKVTKKVPSNDDPKVMIDKTEFVYEKRGGSISTRIIPWHAFSDYQTFKFKGGQHDKTFISLTSAKSEVIVVWEDINASNRKTETRMKLFREQLRAERMEKSQKGELVSTPTIIWARCADDQKYGFLRRLAKVGRLPYRFVNLMDIEIPREVAERSTRIVMAYKTIKKGELVGATKGTPLPSKAYYICIRNNAIDTKYHSTRFAMSSYLDLDNIKDALVAAGEPDLPLVCIPASNKKLLEDIGPDFIDFEKLVTDSIEALFDFDYLVSGCVMTSNPVMKIVEFLEHGNPLSVRDDTIRDFYSIYDERRGQYFRSSSVLLQECAKEMYFRLIGHEEAEKIRQKARAIGHETTAILDGLAGVIFERHNMLFVLSHLNVPWMASGEIDKAYQEEVKNYLNKI